MTFIDPNCHVFVTTSSAAQRFLAALPSTVEYAVERGLSTLDQPFKSDLDLVITKQGFFIMYEMAKQRGLIVSVTLSFGGARLFLGFDDGAVKRIDCMWYASYIGIPLCDTRQLLNSRVKDPDTQLYVLSERMQAEVAFAVKNARGGVEKYRELLGRHQLEVLTATARRRWLSSLAVRRPLLSFFGLCRTLFVYFLRLIFPSGVSACGATYEMLHASIPLRYLFQGRIRPASAATAFLRSRLLAEFCLVRSRTIADIDLSGTNDLRSAEQAVLAFLRDRRADVPRLLALMA